MHFMIAPSSLTGASPYLKIVTQGTLRDADKSSLPTMSCRHNCLHHRRAVISIMQDLFQDTEDVEVERADGAPLATRMRPRSLDELVGQEHILAPGKLLRRAIEADRLPSVIF